MAEKDLDRNEAATPHKLEEAKKNGQVAKSADVASALVFATAVVYLNGLGWDAFLQQFKFDQAVFAHVAQSNSGRELMSLIGDAVISALLLMGPFFGAIVLAAIIGNLVQSGPILTGKPLGPNWGRLNPATGFKRMLSLRTLFDTARACLKLVLLAAVTYHALKRLLPQFHALASMTPLAYLDTLLRDMSSLGLKLALMLGLIAAVDWIYTKREFARNMKMSRRELRDEMKHRDGDARIRARLRDLRREMLKRSLSLGKTRHADVLITNPTHIAVALRYAHGEMSSPQLIAKGAGIAAAAMRKIARDHHIPVVQNRTLARKLFHCVGFEEQVPPDMYTDVARIIIWVLAMRRAADALRANTGTAFGSR